jgi:hypothetical protein
MEKKVDSYHFHHGACWFALVIFEVVSPHSPSHVWQFKKMKRLSRWGLISNPLKRFKAVAYFGIS